MSTNQQNNSAPAWLGWLKIAVGILGIFTQAVEAQQSQVTSPVSTSAHVNMIHAGASIVTTKVEN